MAIRVVPVSPRKPRDVGEPVPVKVTVTKAISIIDDSPPSPTPEMLRYVESVVAKRGRPASGKQVVSLRLDPDIIAAFRATGPGWQARINEALRKAKP